MEEALGGSLEPLGGSWPTWEGPAGMIHLGKHWLNLALDRESPRPNMWVRVLKRTNNDDGRRFSRIGMVKRETEMAKRSGQGGGRIAKKAEGKEWNADVDKFDSDLLEEPVDVGGADVDGLWDNEVAEKERGRTMRDEEDEEEDEEEEEEEEEEGEGEGEEGEEEGQKRRQWQRLTRWRQPGK